MRIEKAKEAIQYLQRYVELAENYNVISLETAIIKTYSETMNGAETAKIVNGLGYRIPSNRGERKITPNDVSVILTSDPIDELHKIVQKMQQKNYQKAMKSWG